MLFGVNSCCSVHLNEAGLQKGSGKIALDPEKVVEFLE